MIETGHIHTHSITVNERRYDPTRTTTLRNRFAKEMRKRFRALRGEIRKAIVEYDVLGLKEPTANISPGPKAFDFPRSQDKADSFMDWLNQEVDRGVLQTGQAKQLGQGIDSRWTDTYITDSYNRGVQRANFEMKKAGYEIASIEQQGGIDAVMSQPMHVDRLGVLYSRAFNELKGITDAMGQQISRVLTQGIADGDNPRLLGQKLNAVIKGGGADLGLTDSLGRYIPAERRAQIMARTEIIRAHHQGTMQEYRNWKADGVHVKAEWQTAGDNRVCTRCLSWQSGGSYSLDKMQNLIPIHPQCRCVALPTKPISSKKKK